MKKHTLLWLWLALLLPLVNAQQLTVKRIFTPMQDHAKSQYFPVLNRNGDKLLFSTSAYAGLSLYQFETSEIIPISSELGSGYEPEFDNSGTRIFYRVTSFVNGRRYDGIESFDLNRRNRVPMLSPQRDLKQLRSFHNGFLVSTENRILKATFGRTSNENLLYVSTEDLKIVLVRNNQKTFLNPLNMDESRYLWVSLSPNQQHILFTAAGRGTFVSDLQGRVIADLGYLNAPVWYNNQWVSGMIDKDDGHRVISSTVVMQHIPTKKQIQISTPNEIAMYPSASAIAGRIAWHTDAGKIRVAEISIP